MFGRGSDWSADRGGLLVSIRNAGEELSAEGVEVGAFEEAKKVFKNGRIFEMTSLVLYGIPLMALNGIDANGRYIYRVVEPRIDTEIRRLLSFISDNKSLLLMDISNETNAEQYVETKTREFLEEHYGWINEGLMVKVLYYIKKEFVGMGDLDPFFADQRIEDITVSGRGQPVYVKLSGNDKSRGGYYATDITPMDDYDVLILKVSQKAGLTPNYLKPILDGTIQSNQDRINVVFGEQVSPSGGAITIRNVKEEPLSIADILISKEINIEMASWLWYVVEKGASGLIFGSTGSGKTTLLNTILSLIPNNKKIVVIEDTTELRLPNDSNSTSGITRIASSQQLGYRTVSLHDLLVVSLRERPDYIVVGEIRGREAYTLFDAMSTGHIGYGTLHAGGLEDMQNRFANDPNAEGSMYVPPALQNSVNFILHVSQVIMQETGARRGRRVMNIWENRPVEYRIQGTEGVSIAPEFVKDKLGNGLFSYVPSTDSFEGPSNQMLEGYLVDMFASREGKTHEEAVKDLNRRATVLNYIVANRKKMDNSTIQKEIRYYSMTKKMKDEWLGYAVNLPYSGGI